MTKNQVLKKTLFDSSRFAVAVSLAVFLAGCGGLGNLAEPEQVPAPERPAPEIKPLQHFPGKAIDGFTTESFVCFDINKNASCDSDEPNSLTSQDSIYQFFSAREFELSGNELASVAQNQWVWQQPLSGSSFTLSDTAKAYRHNGELTAYYALPVWQGCYDVTGTTAIRCNAVRFAPQQQITTKISHSFPLNNQLGKILTQSYLVSI